MCKLILTILAGGLVLKICQGQNIRYSVGMPYISVSAYSAKQADVFSFKSNQAALAKIQSWGVGVFSERRFLLAENSVYSAAAAFNGGRLGNFGCNVTYAGYSLFNENNIGLSYAKSLGQMVDIGVQFNYYGYRAAGYGNVSTFCFEGGTMFHLSEKLHAGIHAYNPVGGIINKVENEKLASAYKLGLGYDVSEEFFCGAEIIKEEERPVNIIAGMQYHFTKQFFARAGVRTDTGTGFGGVGIAWNGLRLDVAASYHPQLGISPALMFIYTPQQKK